MRTNGSSGRFEDRSTTSGFAFRHHGLLIRHGSLKDPTQWRGGSDIIVGGGVSRLPTSHVPVCIKRLCSNFRSNHSVRVISFQKSAGPN